MSDLGIITIGEIQDRTGFAKSTIQRWMNKGKFPKKLFSASKGMVWSREDVERFLKNKGDKQHDPFY